MCVCVCCYDYRCLENVYTLRYVRTLAKLRQAEEPAALDTVSSDVDDDDGIEMDQI